MTDVDPPAWQQLIEAGLVKDLTGEAFLDNYDEAAIDERDVRRRRSTRSALGRTTYSGMFVNHDLLAEVGVEIPTTLDEFVAACEAIEDAGYKCMIVGGQDGWPVFVGSYGMIGSLYPDQEGLAEGLWTGDNAWNDEQGLEMFDKYGTYASLLDAESAGLTGDSAAQRFTAGDVAFGPSGCVERRADRETAPTSRGRTSRSPAATTLRTTRRCTARYDMSLAVAAETPVPELATAYLAAFSEPDNYNAFANATKYMPTQPTACSDSTLGQSTRPDPAGG